MNRQSVAKNMLLLPLAAVLGWLVPGAGYIVPRQIPRGVIVFVTITATFCAGLYIGSIGVVDQIGAKWWFFAQILTSPAVILLGRLTAGGTYPVYGRPCEIGQLYTSIAGLLNLLCIINAVYITYEQNKDRLEQ